MHLGDYLYEYSSDGYASENAQSMGREVFPKNEILSLEDYRKRHATYKKDKDLQLLHSSKPMIAVWDDHEVSNDSWKEGAETILLTRVLLEKEKNMLSRLTLNGCQFEKKIIKNIYGEILLSETFLI